MIKQTKSNFIKYSELKKWIEWMLNWGITMVDWYFRFTRGIRDYTIWSMWTQVKHIGMILEKYIDLEDLKYTTNYVKFKRNKHNALELKKLLEII